MAGGPSIRLYRAAWSTNCERVGLALAHKGIEALSVLIEYGDRSPVEAVSGQGLVPVIEDAGEVVSDSVAILRHLERRRPGPPLFPADPARRAEVDVFIDWFERVYKQAPNELERELERERPDEARVERDGAEMHARLAVFERLLDGREYLLGEFGAADCVAYPFLKYAAHRDPADTELFHVILADHQRLGDDHPNLAAWIKRVGERPLAY
ncbi:MAG: glutathione S-transferase family protein [Solirubrobacterales bacterium]